VGSGDNLDHGQAEQSEPDNLLESGMKVPAADQQERMKIQKKKVSSSLSRVN
jgi:hypothetical protein